MKVLIADKFEPSGIDGLREAGCDVIYQPDVKDEALTAAVGETQADVLVVRSTRVTKPVLDAGRLSLVVRAGAGYNTIDVAAASDRGIYVSNCPGKNAIAVAELAFGLILALDRRIPDNVVALRGGQWRKQEFSRARGLYGRTLGLLGIGSIGREMVKRAAAFGLPVVVWSRRFDGQDRPLTAAELGDLQLEAAARQIPVSVAPTPADVAARADILSIHLALAPGTQRLVNAAVLDRLRPGALVVNTARSEIVDYQALESAVEARGLRVALDVYDDEPTGGAGFFRPSIGRHESVYGTHHIGASTDQAQEAIAAETVRVIRTYKATGQVPNVVNLAKRSPATHMLVVRHHDRPGVLAHVFDQLRERRLNVQETQNIVFERARAAVARINLDGAPDEGCLEAIQANSDVIDVQVIEL